MKERKRENSYRKKWERGQKHVELPCFRKVPRQQVGLSRKGKRTRRRRKERKGGKRKATTVTRRRGRMKKTKRRRMTRWNKRERRTMLARTKEGEGRQRR